MRRPNIPTTIFTITVLISIVIIALTLYGEILLFSEQVSLKKNEGLCLVTLQRLPPYFYNCSN